MHFLVKNAPKRNFLAFLKLLGDVVGESVFLPLKPVYLFLSRLYSRAYTIIYRGMLAAIPLSFLLWNVEAYPL